MLLLLSALRALVEVAGLALLGQGVLHALAGAARDRNPIYRLFQIISRPAVRLARVLAPRFIADRRIPLLTFFLLFALWIALGIAKRLLV